MLNLDKMCIHNTPVPAQAPSIKVIPTETPVPENMTQNIITKIHNMFGIKLAGYFNVDANLRDKDVVVKIFYRGHTLGVGVSKTVEEAVDHALHTTIKPTLTGVRDDLNQILEKLELVENGS